MVRVGAGIRNDLNGFLECDSFFREQADQLRDDHARMRIIDLDGSVVRKVVEIAAACFTFVQDQLRAGRYHQILLIDPQKASVVIGIIRIQEQGQILRMFLLSKEMPSLMTDSSTVSRSNRFRVFVPSAVACHCKAVHPRKVCGPASVTGYAILVRSAQSAPLSQ